MTEILLIRHAQAEGNVYKIMQGFWDGSVTALGVLQQKALKKRGLRVDAVYSSDLKRAVFTAQAAAEPNGLPVICDRRLREIDVGPWEQHFFGNLIHDEPQSAYDFMFRGEQWQTEGAETYHHVRERLYEVIEEIARRNDGRRIAIVSHGVSIRCFTSKVTGISLNDTGTLPIFGNTSVSHFTYENGIFTAGKLNDQTHLESLALPVFEKTEALRHEFIDPAAQSDYYTACYTDAWLSAHGNLENYSPLPYLRSAEKHHAFDSRSVIKLYNRDEPAGLVELDMEHGAQEGIGWISLLYLNKSYRGRGYGIQALARPILLYRQAGRKELRLHVAEDNFRAGEFYKRNGFRRLRSVPGGLILMSRSLDV